MKKSQYYMICAMATLAFASCSDWLDVTPKDKVPKEKQYATQDGIQSALNGIYRQFIDADLYGAQLTGTTLDMMGHFYTYPNTQPSDESAKNVYALATFDYTSRSAVRNKFESIWRDAYSTILNINDFIDGVQNSTAIMSAEDKNIVLGEAYGLRAYICFDLFRLFAPYNAEPSKKILPYATGIDIVLNHSGYEEDVYKTRTEYIALLLKDIQEATDKLQKDPVISDDTSISNSLVSDYYKNRNRRMNYYAVKGLEARILQYIGHMSGAAQAAQVITDLVDAGKRFTWAPPSSVGNNSNYILFTEVVFGINNLDMSSNNSLYFTGNDIKQSYVVEQNNLFMNIYAGFPSDLAGITADVRARQWRGSRISGATPYYPTTPTFMSYKHELTSYSTYPAIKDLQVLLRVSEMYYVQAEYALASNDKKRAITILNTVLMNRGLTGQFYLPDDAAEQDIRDHITREYYKEFYSEGQVYFYHKRLQSTTMFKGNDAGTMTVDPAKAYIVPIPQAETEN